MALSKKIVEMLVCPNCKESLEYDEANNKLNCQKCSLVYKINNDVPVLLVDEAEKM